MKETHLNTEGTNTAPKVVGMHFVCREGDGVADDGKGVFLTGSWKVDPKHLETVEYVALHSSRAEPSHRQGRVLAWFEDPREAGRFVIVAFTEGAPREWQGHGTGEKGYVWREQG